MKIFVKVLKQLLLTLGCIINIIFILACSWILIGWITFSRTEEHLIFHFNPIRTTIYLLISIKIFIILIKKLNKY